MYQESWKVSISYCGNHVYNEYYMETIQISDKVLKNNIIELQIIVFSAKMINIGNQWYELIWFTEICFCNE